LVAAAIARRGLAGLVRTVCRWRARPREVAESTRVVAGYLERGTQECTTLGETLTVKQRMRVVDFIADLVDDLGLRKPTALFAINYFDRWFSSMA